MTVIEEILLEAVNRPVELRKGQAVYNSAYKKFPELVKKIGSCYDCYYCDERIESFLEKLRSLLNADDCLHVPGYFEPKSSSGKMMRAIKFRGKIKVNGKWIYGDIAHLYGEVLMQTDISDDEKRGTIGWDVFPESIGQFTGIVDRNGVEIYEGDIIQTYDSGGKPVPHEVYYLEREARFATRLIGYDYLNEGEITQKWINEIGFKVIGNIFDNPELLKKGE